MPPANAAIHRRHQLDAWCERLTGHSPRVILADGDDPRIVAAAAELASDTPVRPVLVLPADSVESEFAAHHAVDLTGVETVSASTLRVDPAVVQVLRERPDGRPRDEEEVEQLVQDPVYLAAAEVAMGRASACVAGASRPTGEVIRAGLKVIGLAPGVSTVSSCFIMVLADGRRFGYGDCAVLPTPDERQLAEVAVATSGTFRDLTGIEPQVAMLSFSTLGSAKHADVDVVRRATTLARELDPGLCVDGELQFDAAVVEEVGREKASTSRVAGHANVLIFPNLAAGNIGYKITERLAGAVAIGPILQGLAAPMNDLSRGCSSDDVVCVALLSAVQAIESGRTAPAV